MARVGLDYRPAWDRARRDKELASSDKKTIALRAIEAALIEHEDLHRDGRTIHASVRFHRWLFDYAVTLLHGTVEA